MVTTRRVIGILAAVLTAASIFFRWFLNTMHFYYQLDRWLYIATFAIVIVYGAMWLLYAVRKLHWALQTLIVIAAVSLPVYILSILLMFGYLTPDREIWSDNQYVVYHERNDMIDPGKFVLYKRDVMIEIPSGTLGRQFFAPDRVEYFIDEEKKLVREEADWTFDGKSWHTTLYYHLGDRGSDMSAYEEKPLKQTEETVESSLSE